VSLKLRAGDRTVGNATGKKGGQAEKGPSVLSWGQWKIQNSFEIEEEQKDIFGRGKMAVVTIRSNCPQ